MEGILFGNCLEVLRDFPDGSFDMILIDPPLGITDSDWDVAVPVDTLWKTHWRLLREDRMMVIIASEPYASLLIASNLEAFSYDLVWAKNKASGHLNAERMPLRAHERILVFSKGSNRYFPQKKQGYWPVNRAHKKPREANVYGAERRDYVSGGNTDRYPTSLLDFPVVNNDSPERIHANQKPIALLEWLILSYTQPDEIILDSFFGSGSTGIAALRTGRSFVGVESDERIYKLAEARFDLYSGQLSLSV